MNGCSQNLTLKQFEHFILVGFVSFVYSEGKCADTIGTVPDPWVAISNDEIKIYFSNKIHGSNFIKQHSETVSPMV